MNPVEEQVPTLIVVGAAVVHLKAAQCNQSAFHTEDYHITQRRFIFSIQLCFFYHRNVNWSNNTIQVHATATFSLIFFKDVRGIDHCDFRGPKLNICSCPLL